MGCGNCRQGHGFIHAPYTVRKQQDYTFVNFAVYGHTLIRQLTVPSLPLSFTPNLITVIINYLSLNYPVSSISRTLLLVLSWKLPSHVISLLSYALFAGSGSLNASNTSSSHLLYKVLTTIQPPYLHKLISTQRHRSTRSSSIVTLARPASSSSLKTTDRSFRYASPSLESASFVSS